MLKTVPHHPIVCHIFKLLLHKDSSILLFCFNKLKSVVVSTSSSSRPLSLVWQRLLGFCVRRDASLLLAFISLLIMLPTWWIVSSWMVWGIILFLYSIIRALKLWRTAKLQMTLRKYRVRLEDMAANSRAFTNLVRKSLRLIQETEVISRGFTLWVHFSLYFLNDSVLLFTLRRISCFYFCITVMMAGEVHVVC